MIQELINPKNGNSSTNHLNFKLYYYTIVIHHVPKVTYDEISLHQFLEIFISPRTYMLKMISCVIIIISVYVFISQPFYKFI